jgi:hypothetical protein
MHTETVLLILMSAIAASTIVLLQYYYRSKGRGKLTLLLSLLRFLALFCLILLLVNPKFPRREYHLEKANLVVLVDNSSSMQEADKETDIGSLVASFTNNPYLADIFNIHGFSFHSALDPLDSLQFVGKGTDMARALTSLGTLFGKRGTAVVMISDGNQTLGQDYAFYRAPEKFTIFPVVVGDTAIYEDIRISSANVNRYAFLKNKFPLETFIAYDGTANITKKVRITMDGKTVATETVNLSNTKNSIRLNTLLQANTVGVRTLGISVEPLENERNLVNNQRELALEVLDEKTRVAIISNVVHPDIGALKRSIEQNEQRSVVVLGPGTENARLEAVDLFVLYQPDNSFSAIYDHIARKNVNALTITGPKTDWDFLNKVQNSVERNSLDQTEEISPVLETGTSLFDISNFSITNFPPLTGHLGEIMINVPHETLIGQRIMGVEIGQPLLSVTTSEGRKEGFLFGEHLWKWRIQSFRDQGDFKNFDGFMGQLMLYLSSSRPKERLELEYAPIILGAGAPKIRARYFDANYSFDPNASLILELKQQSGVVEMPFLSKNGYFEVDLGNLEAGDHEFLVRVEGENIRKGGRLKMLDFDVEKQLRSSDHGKMGRLAQRSGGSLYFPGQIETLVSALLEDQRFLPTQIASENVVPLIDFKLLLAIIVAAFTLEWFLRKFNGLT